MATYYVEQSVLIVPLWNWNDNLLQAHDKYVGFNRTFMELKSFRVMRV